METEKIIERVMENILHLEDKIKRCDAAEMIGSANEYRLQLFIQKAALSSLTAAAIGYIHPITPFTFGRSSGAIFKDETRHYYKPVYDAPPLPKVIFNRGTLATDGSFVMPVRRFVEMLHEQGFEVEE
jgi:hypothetical protein